MNKNLINFSLFLKKNGIINSFSNFIKNYNKNKINLNYFLAQKIKESKFNSQIFYLIFFSFIK